MGYIRSPEHFINFINKVIKENIHSLNYEELLPEQTYLSFIYQKGLQDQFTWAIKDDPCILENDNMLLWLQRNIGIGIPSIPSDMESKITQEFSSIISDLENIPGVYSFWTKSDIPIYIGMSIDLQSRVMSSYRERFFNYKKPVYFKYLFSDTSSNAALLEVYYICLFKPSLNSTSKYSDNITLDIINNVPKFSNPVLCNIIKSKKKV